ncbi:MAG: hypothetical protein Sapg2KO_47250 [Saprospiraceae bacterium]
MNAFEKRLLVIHFTQDFTYGKPQLGGYGRILNTLDPAQRHIVYTISARDNLERKNFTAGKGFEVRQMPAYMSTGRIKERLGCVRNISALMAADLKKQGLEPDIFFGHSQLPNFLILSRVKRMLKSNSPLIWEFNAIWGGINVKSLKNRLAVQIMRHFERTIVKKADALVFQTTAAQEWIKKLYGPSNGIQLILTNAVPTTALVNREFTEKPSIPPKILVNGLFDSMNGLGLMVDYLKKYPQPPVELHFFGTGPWGEELKKLADGEKVVFHGSVSREVMQKAYLNFDFHLIPRLKRVEADLFIPSKLLEAMGKGLVPIVSKVRGMTEVVKEDEGFIIEAGSLDALASIFNKIVELSPEEWLQRSNKSQQKIKEEYLWGENHKKLANLYRNLKKY